MQPVVRIAVMLLLVASASGCMRVVRPSPDRLEVAAPDASFEERRASFVALRPEGLDVTHVTHYDRMFGRHEQWVNSLQLSNGVLVYSPEVLLTAIDPGSPTATSIERYHRFRRLANRRLWIARGFGIALLGSVVAAVSVRDTDTRLAMVATGGGFLLGWAGSRWALRVAMRRRDRAEYDAYLSYDADLAAHLGVCVGQDGETVRPCR